MLSVDGPCLPNICDFGNNASYWNVEKVTEDVLLA